MGPSALDASVDELVLLVHPSIRSYKSCEGGIKGMFLSSTGVSNFSESSAQAELLMHSTYCHDILVYCRAEELLDPQLPLDYNSHHPQSLAILAESPLGKLQSPYPWFTAM